MTVGLMPVGGATVSGPEHYTDTQGRASLNVWSAQCQVLRRREHRQKDTHPIPGQKLKSLAPPGIEPGRDPTDHATATDVRKIELLPLLFIEPLYN